MAQEKPSSRHRRPQGFGFRVFLVILSVICSLLMVWAAFVVQSWGAALSALFGVSAAGFLFLGYAGYRKLRPRRARHLQVSVDRRELRRGEPVDVTLSLLNPRKVGKRLDLGLICTELYEEKRTVSTQHGTSTQQVTVEHVEHEEWREVSRTEPHQRHRFVVPDSAPYSHQGECLSFSWRVSAREPTRFRFDPSANEEIEVRP